MKVIKYTIKIVEELKGISEVRTNESERKCLSPSEQGFEKFSLYCVFFSSFRFKRAK